MPDWQFQSYIVLMLENRSFDHLFGYLGKGDGLPPGGGTNYLAAGDKTTEAFASRKGGDFTAVGDGPSHSLAQTNVQLFSAERPNPGATATLEGFAESFDKVLTFDLKRKPVSSEVQQVMNCFDPTQLPVLSTLAQQYVLCDRWFADVPGPTMPNRAFVHAATSQGYTDNRNWKPTFTCKTLYDRISGTPDRSWCNYHFDHTDVLAMYPNLKAGTTNFRAFAEFVSDVAGDRLPSYSFITPAFMGTPEQPVNSMHAPKDVRPAEKLVADTYSALQQHPNVFQKTLLIVVFDEHGGYYDHVVPPATVNPDGMPGRTDESFLPPFDFERLGLRVPAILISPWFQAAVDSTEYSHATIPGSMIDALELRGGYLTKRDTNAQKLTQRYLVKDPARVWRTPPSVAVSMQPHSLDDIQREVLGGAALLDPDPQKQTTVRVEDIRDPARAREFIETQVAKRLEHNIASNWQGTPLPTASAYNELPGPEVSPARIAELRRKASPPGPRP
jgi:hypothetical protein